MIAYPAFHRLPSFDPARIELENAEDPDGQSENQVLLRVKSLGLRALGVLYLVTVRWCIILLASFLLHSFLDCGSFMLSCRTYWSRRSPLFGGLVRN